jgi:hypothetical protein
MNENIPEDAVTILDRVDAEIERQTRRVDASTLSVAERAAYEKRLSELRQTRADIQRFVIDIFKDAPVVYGRPETVTEMSGEPIERTADTCQCDPQTNVGGGLFHGDRLFCYTCRKWVKLGRRPFRS